ncbi:hypothetical protein ACVWYQ_003693 [Bradyrhizobium sp. USDA 3397]
MVFVLLFENVLRRDRFAVLIGANLKTADQEQLLSLVDDKRRSFRNEQYWRLLAQRLVPLHMKSIRPLKAALPNEACC